MSSRTQAQARQSQPQPENKTKQDVNSGSKPGKPSGGGGYPRGGGGRRREPNSTSFSSAVPHRPPPRGGRFNGGKQPPNRGYQPPYQQYAAVTEADEFEVGSIFKSGSKKQSLNHLLNFQYTPRGSSEHQPDGRDRGRPRDSRKQNQVYRPSYSKEQYLQANCQFIVNGNQDYSVHQVDPDIPVNWDLIEEVHLKTAGTDPLSCPICLFPPTAGKISRCGHVFCWPCILHYLALSDDRWRKCPICYDNIQQTDLKSVQVFQQENHVTGTTIEMRLMKRERSSLFAVPVAHPGLGNYARVGDTDLNRSLSKLILAGAEEVMVGILEREQRELEQQYREEKEQPESVFIQQALVLLQTRREQVLAMKDLPPVKFHLAPVGANYPPPAFDLLPPLEEVKFVLSPAEDPFENLEDVLQRMDLNTQKVEESPADIKVISEEVQAGDDPRPRHLSSGSSDPGSDGEDVTETTVTAADLDISSVQPVNLENNVNKQTPKSTFYFYQDAAGQLIFLHALNVNMLVHEFGSFENCPPTISARILEKDSSTMTEELRDRLRYLRHLPVSSAFDVAELDLSAVVGWNTLAVFKDQIEGRKRKRQRKMKAEKIRENRIRLDEMRIMGRFPSPMARIESAYHYPMMGESAAGYVEPRPRSSSPDSINSMDHAYPQPGESTSARNYTSGGTRNYAAVGGYSASTGGFSGSGGGWGSGGGGGLNFAKIIKQGAAPAARPVNTRPVRSSGMVLLGGPLPSRPRHGSESEPEAEGYAPPPPATLSCNLGDALAQALAQADHPTTTNKKGKKSRGKQILLTGGSQRPIF